MLIKFVYGILAVATIGECFVLMGLREDTDIYIREKTDRNCQWFNSGVMGLIPRRFNGTTLCRCRLIGVYECSTVIVHTTTTKRPLVNTPSSGDSSNVLVANRNSTMAVIPNSIKDVVKLTTPSSTGPAIALGSSTTQTTKLLSSISEKPSSLNLTRT